MTKKEYINRIQKIIREWGSFDSAEVEDSEGMTYSPCVTRMGNLVGLAETFELNGVEVNVYDTESVSCDPTDTYTEPYEKLSTDILKKILSLCEQYDAIMRKPKKKSK